MAVSFLRHFKNAYLTGKLRSSSLMVVLACNLLLPPLSCLLLQAVVTFQLEHNLLQVVTIPYYMKLTVLTLLFDLILLGILDYLAILLPIFQLEETVRTVERSGGVDLQAPDPRHFTTSCWEQVFYNLLDTQTELFRQRRKEEKERQIMELYALQRQINPHFLYNTLDSIRGLALVHDAPEVADMTESLSRLFHSMIGKEGQMLSLREELKNVTDYVTIQQFRFSNRFSFCSTIPEKLLDQVSVPNLCLQPLVENAIVHGLESKVSGGKLVVSGYATEQRLVLTITDNGVGIPEKKLLELNNYLDNEYTADQDTALRFHFGIALANINRQIRLKFGNQYGIHLDSTPELYTSTELVLPVIPLQRREKLYE